MSNDKAINFLKEGQTLREQGFTFDAIDKINRAMELFIDQKNYSEASHCILDRAICWQHLYQFQSNDIAYAILYRSDARAMLELVKEKELNKKLAEAYFINAKAEGLFNNIEESVNYSELAIEKLPTDKSAQKGDWRTNYGKALYLSGDKDKGITEMIEGIKQIEDNHNQVDDYTAKVWISGGYLRLAEILDRDDSETAKVYLDQAKEIIDEDPKLFSVRLKQLNNLIKTGISGL